MMYDYWGQGSSNGSSYDVWGFVFMLLMMALVIVGIIAVVRHLGRDSGRHQKGEALDLLEKRYAQGEIDKKEFEEKRTTLSQ
jgi:putative membrane protein